MGPESRELFQSNIATTVSLATDIKRRWIDDKSREEAALAHFSEFLEEHGFSAVNTVVRVGDPGLEISEYAKETRADLIVVPSHGFHGLKRMVLGSVAERVIRHAECAVLVLRRPDAG
ncbi:MAG: universal stress protein [Planctomycetes bacterium]|nr:universal stress protein [Planctomycetota bacterium]